MNITKGKSVITSPVVPRYEPRVRNEPISAPRAQGVSADAFGAGLARGLNQLAGDAFAQAKQEADRLNHAAVLEARVKADKLATSLLMDPTRGALNRKGKDAFGVAQPTLEEFDRGVAEIENSLAGDEQKQTFRLFALQNRNDIDKQLQRHAYVETKSYAEEANKAALGSALENVSTFYNDPERVAQEMKFGHAVILSDPNNSGLPQEAISLRRKAWETSVYGAVIDRMAIDQPGKALDYLEVHKDEMVADAYDKAAAKLKPLAEAQQGTDSAETIFSANPGAPLPDLLKQAREAHDGNPSVLRHAESRLRQMHADNEDAKKDAIDRAEAEVYKYIVEAKLKGGVPSRATVPREAWARLAAADPKAADRVADELARGQEHATDRARINQERVDNKPSVEMTTTWGLLKSDPQTLAATSLDVLYGRGDINKSQYEDLVKQKISNQKENGYRPTRRDETAINAVLEPLGISKSKDSNKYYQFWEAYNTRQRDEYEDRGRNLTQDEKVNLARVLLAEVSQQESFFGIDQLWPDSKKRVFEADFASVAVPSEHRAAIVQSLQKNGMPATEEAIKEAYLTQVEKGAMK